MKVNEVPQDLDENYEGHSKIRYGRDEKGQMIKVKSCGDNVEKTVTAYAWNEINQHIQNVYRQVMKGELSPLAFYMEKNLLTTDILAANVGLWNWQVKRHLKPKNFKKLNSKVLSRYAQYFEIPIEQISQLPEVKVED